MSPSFIQEITKNIQESDDDSSDEDFVLEKYDNKHDSESNETVSDENYDSGDEKVIDSLKRKKRDDDEFYDKDYNEGIKTRSQKTRNEKVSKHAPEQVEANVNDIWDRMNEKKVAQEVNYTPFDSSVEEKVKITRTYEFAGKIETEEKFVSKNSAEAKAHFSSINVTQTTKPALRRPTKRVSFLETANHKPIKLNILEKSRLDWAKFVDKEGISEELKNASKDSYMDKQMFLQVAEERMFKNIKEGMKK